MLPDYELPTVRLLARISGAPFDAGLEDVTVTTVDAEYDSASADDPVRMVQDATVAARGIIADRPEVTRIAARVEVRRALGRCETASGWVCPAQFHVTGGQKPGWNIAFGCGSDTTRSAAWSSASSSSPM
jgi:hypothetical protein